MTHGGSSAGAHPPADLVAHLAVALVRHVHELRRSGDPVPADLDALTAFAVHFVRSRADAADADLDEIQHECATERLLLTKREAAQRLMVSERTIDRLVAAGRIPLVHVERAARLRVEDLEAYVGGLAG